MKEYHSMLRLALLFSLVTVALTQIAACRIDGGGSSNSSEVSTGKGGSQARFTVVDDYLYAISGSNLQIFDVATASNPAPWSTQYIGFDIETLFSYNQYLFIGSGTGVYIYDNTNPQFPEQVSSLLHARSCDPVVVEGSYAYLTLRNDNPDCGGNSNQLDIIDLTDITNLVLTASYAMQSPAGLGIDTGKLFVCDGIAGLKVFDVADPGNVALADWVSDQNCYDVVPNNGTLVVSGYSGIYQYSYLALPMTELSVLTDQ